MPQVDFYILQGQEPRQHEITVCRLVNKAFQQGLKTYIHTSNAEDAEKFDKILWTFQANSFIPHCIQNGKSEEEWPVMIGLAAPEEQYDVLVNLTNKMPDNTGSFKRIIEVIDNNQQDKDQGRERFRNYRDQGHELETHDL